MLKAVANGVQHCIKICPARDWNSKPTAYLDLMLAHLFAKLPRPGDSEVTFSVRVKLPPVTIYLNIKGRGDPVKCLLHGHNKRPCRLYLHTITLLLDVKQGSC